MLRARFSKSKQKTRSLNHAFISATVVWATNLASQPYNGPRFYLRGPYFCPQNVLPFLYMCSISLKRVGEILKRGQISRYNGPNLINSSFRSLVHKIFTASETLPTFFRIMRHRLYLENRIMTHRCPSNEPQKYLQVIGFTQDPGSQLLKLICYINKQTSPAVSLSGEIL